MVFNLTYINISISHNICFQVTLPCGYFSRGGTYYLELIADKETFSNDYENSTDSFEENYVKREANFENNYKNDFESNVNSEIETDDKNYGKSEDNLKNSTSSDLNPQQIDNVSFKPREKRGVSYKDYLNRGLNEMRVKRDDGSIMETGDSVVKSWKFDVLWPSANLDVTPEQIATYPERQVTAILEFPRVVCTPMEPSADFWLELLYCGHSSGGAVLCDGKNSSSHAHVLYSEQV